MQHSYEKLPFCTDFHLCGNRHALLAWLLLPTRRLVSQGIRDTDLAPFAAFSGRLIGQGVRGSPDPPSSRGDNSTRCALPSTGLRDVMRTGPLRTFCGANPMMKE